MKKEVKQQFKITFIENVDLFCLFYGIKLEMDF